MIVQLSSVATPSMLPMCNEVKNNASNIWISNYATRPSHLFAGVCIDLTIIQENINELKKNTSVFSTKYMRWTPKSRYYLFNNICFNAIENNSFLFDFSIPKLTNFKENKIIETIKKERTILANYLANKDITTKQKIFFRTAGGRYFKVFSDRSFGSDSTSNKSKYFQNRYNVYALISVLSSNLWWWYFTLHFDMYNCKDYMIFNFPFNYFKCKQLDSLVSLGKQFTDDLFNNSISKTTLHKTTGKQEERTFKVSKSKPIIDEIDKVLAKHYGFTEEELDYIINYDIKYRMGNELDEN